ncbi:EamA family transporter [Candidatus Woesearchaeota archaeon]|nr:EamA family transporter [Candidatus Woesearchaeota archaeon]
MLSQGIVFGLLSMLGYGLANSLVKIPAGRIGNEKTVFYRTLFSSAMLFIVMILFLELTSFVLTYIIIAFMIAALGYVPLASFYKSVETGKVGIVVPIANSSVMYTVLFSLLFYGESLSGLETLSIILIISGIILISLNLKSIKNSHIFSLKSGVPYALLTSLLWGAVFFLFKIPASVLGPFLTALIIESGIVIISAARLKYSGKGFSADRRSLVYVFFIGIFASAGILFFNIGIAFSGVSIVAAVAFSNPLISTLAGRIFFRERLSFKEYSAIGMLIAGIVILSV